MVFTFLKTLKDLSFETQNLCHLDDMGVGCVHRKMVKNDRNNFEIPTLVYHAEKEILQVFLSRIY